VVEAADDITELVNGEGLNRSVRIVPRPLSERSDHAANVQQSEQDSTVFWLRADVRQGQHDEQHGRFPSLWTDLYVVKVGLV
jgi:hypothetical protein